MMKYTIGYAFAEFRMPEAMSPSGDWKELEDYYVPKTIAATHRLTLLEPQSRFGDKLLEI